VAGGDFEDEIQTGLHIIESDYGGESLGDFRKPFY